MMIKLIKKIKNVFLKDTITDKQRIKNFILKLEHSKDLAEINIDNNIEKFGYECTLYKIFISNSIMSKIDELKYVKDIVEEFNKRDKQVNKLKKDMTKTHKKLKGENNKDIIAKNQLMLDICNNSLSELKESIEIYITVYEKFLANNITEDSLNKLLKFIMFSDEHEINNKHINTYKNIPNLTNEELETFDKFASEYNEIIKQKEILKKQSLNETNVVKVEYKLSANNKKENITTTDKKYIINIDEEEQLRDLYIENKRSKIIFDNFLNMNKFDDIKILFPKFTDNDYFSTKQDIISLLDNHIEEINNLLALDDENESLICTAEIFEQYMDEVCEYFEKQELVVDSNTNEVNNNVNIFCSVSQSGKNYILDDFDNIEKEKREDVQILLDKLKNKIFTHNIAKQRKLFLNNQNGGIFELKKFGIRLIYKDLGNDNFYIFMIFRKNNNNINEHSKTINNRITQCMPHLREIQQNIENEEYVNFELQRSAEVFKIINEKNNKK